MLKLIILIYVLFLIETKLIKNKTLDYFCKKYFKIVMYVLLLLNGIVSALTFKVFSVLITIVIFYIFYKKEDSIIK